MCCAPRCSFNFHHWKCQVYYLLFDRIPLNDVCFCPIHVIQQAAGKTNQNASSFFCFQMILMTNWFHIRDSFFFKFQLTVDCSAWIVWLHTLRHPLNCKRTMNCFSVESSAYYFSNSPTRQKLEHTRKKNISKICSRLIFRFYNEN